MNADEETPQEREARAELEEVTRTIGRLIGACMPEGVGFGLIMMNLGERGSFAYTANVKRDDFLNLLREALQKIGGDS